MKSSVYLHGGQPGGVVNQLMESIGSHVKTPMEQWNINYLRDVWQWKPKLFWMDPSLPRSSQIMLLSLERIMLQTKWCHLNHFFLQRQLKHSHLTHPIVQFSGMKGRCFIKLLDTMLKNKLSGDWCRLHSEHRGICARSCGHRKDHVDESLRWGVPQGTN